MSVIPRPNRPGWLQANDRIPVLLLVGWAALYLPRTVLAGFYHDDWWLIIEVQNGAGPFSLTRLARFVDLGGAFAPRPVQGFLCFLISSLANKSPALWQLASGAAMLACGLALRALFRELLRPSAAWGAPPRPGWSLPADFAALAVVANPWSIGLTVWAHMAGALPSLAFFALATLQCLRPGSWWKRGLLSALWLALSYFCYESFYLQWIVWPLLVLLHFKLSWRTIRTAAFFSGVGLTVQLAAIGFNRWIAVVSQSNSKKTPANWRHLAEESITRLPEQLGGTMPGAGRAWLWWAAAAIALSLLAVAFRCRGRWSGWGRALRAGGLYPVAGLLIVITATVYSLGGYALSAQGFMSRTTYGLSLAGALLMFSAVRFGLASNHRWLRQATLAVGLAGAAGLGYYQLRSFSDFAHVWHVQQEVIAAFPAEKLAGVPREGTGVLYIGPSYYRGVVIFGATWDLTGAINNRDGIVRRPYVDLITFYPATANYNWRWEQGTLNQELPGYWQQKSELKRFYVWNYYKRTLEPAPEGFVFAATQHPEHEP